MELFNANAKSVLLDKIKTLGANPSNADRDFIEKTFRYWNRSTQGAVPLLDFMERRAGQQIGAFNQKTNPVQGQQAQFRRLALRFLRLSPRRRPNQPKRRTAAIRLSSLILAGAR